MACATILVHEHPPQLLGNPLGRDDDDLACHRPERLQRVRLDFEVEPGRESNGPQQPKLVLAKPLRRVTDGAQDLVVAGRQVRPRNQSPGSIRDP